MKKNPKNQSKSTANIMKMRQIVGNDPKRSLEYIKIAPMQ